jgi:hypothetical protein
MSLVDRARNIITRPAAEWPVIAMEPATPASLYTGYIIPLAAIAPVCSFIATAVFSHLLVLAAVAAIVGYILELVIVFVVALIAGALAPNFAGTNDGTSALKWIAYGLTPRWVAGFAALIPIVGALIVLVASLYSLYVLYLGAVPMMRVPQDKAVTYSLVLLAIVIVLYILVFVILGAITAAVMISTAAATGALTH